MNAEWILFVGLGPPGPASPLPQRALKRHKWEAQTIDCPVSVSKEEGDDYSVDLDEESQISYLLQTAAAECVAKVPEKIAAATDSNTAG